MNVKNAVNTAMEYVADIFGSENPTHIGLEEVMFNERKNRWEVTIGFSRPWDYEVQGPFAGFQQQIPKRQYKTIQIDNKSGKVISIEIHKTNNE